MNAFQTNQITTIGMLMEFEVDLDIPGTSFGEINPTHNFMVVKDSF